MSQAMFCPKTSVSKTPNQKTPRKISNLASRILALRKKEGFVSRHKQVEDNFAKRQQAILQASSAVNKPDSWTPVATTKKIEKSLTKEPQITELLSDEHDYKPTNKKVRISTYKGPSNNDGAVRFRFEASMPVIVPPAIERICAYQPPSIVKNRNAQKDQPEPPKKSQPVNAAIHKVPRLEVSSTRKCVATRKRNSFPGPRIDQSASARRQCEPALNWTPPKAPHSSKTRNVESAATKLFPVAASQQLAGTRSSQKNLVPTINPIQKNFEFSHYPDIISGKQRQQYRDDFNRDYAEYRQLLAKIQKLANRILELGEKRKKMDKFGSGYKAITKEILNLNGKLTSGKLVIEKANMTYMHAKMQHIKIKLNQFDLMQRKK